MSPAATSPRRLPLLLVSNAPESMEGMTGAAEGAAPRLDYRELAAALGDAPLSFPPAPRGGGIGKSIDALEERTASDIRQAIVAFRRRATVGGFVSFSEKVALPLAVLLGARGSRHIPHVLFAHHLTSERKRALQKRTGYLNRFARIVVLCREQARYLTEEAGIKSARVDFVYYRVDGAFWRADGRRASGEAEGILAVGRERRDYATLGRAARLLPATPFTIVASSPWARGGGENSAGDQPAENLAIRRHLSYGALRDLYATAGAVVVPLEAGTAYAAGVNGVLEAMAMGHAPLVTRTPGIVDYVEDGVTASLIAPDDPVALARAIENTLARPDDAMRRGAAARRFVESGRDMETYVANLARIIREATHDGG